MHFHAAPVPCTPQQSSTSVPAPAARRWRSATALALALALSACGGGGGAGTTASTAGNDLALSYGVQRYPADKLVRHPDIAYTVRPNDGGRQISSDLRMPQELGSPQLTMHLEVVMPPDASAASPRPLLIWVHGGGLVNGNKETLRPFTEAWARAGYVTATIDYRLTPDLAVDPLLHTAALLDATEDLTSAIRYLRSHAAQYAIDSSRIATIGYSAGGEAVMAQAIEPDSLPGTAPDQPAVSGRVHAAVSTGATLFNRFWDSDALLTYQATDTPVLLMHLKPVDPVTLSTWDDNVVPTAARINASGNVCTPYEHRNGQHMADLNFGGTDFAAMDAFLRLHLRLP